MGSNPTKAANNMYCKCRLAAAKYNDKLNSREGAAEMLGLSSSTLASYELDLTKVVPVESIMMMADVYIKKLVLFQCLSFRCRVSES